MDHPIEKFLLDHRIEKFYDKYMHSLKSGAAPYGLLYFDHLYSEYIAIKPSISADSQALMDGLHQRRTDAEPPLTWGDIYLFDLELLKWLPPESLVSKAYDMRSRYRNVAGEKEYELYVASKPPDLSRIAPAQQSPTTPGPSTVRVTPTQQSIAKETTDQSSTTVTPDPTTTNTTATDEPKTANPVTAPEQRAGQLSPEFEMALREDIKYLLKVFYLDYSLMKVREGVREQLMRKGTIWTLWALGIIGLFIFLNDLGSKAPHGDRMYIYTRGLTVGVVVAAGCVGGLMSMLQRILNAPNEGDALFNLASLTNGWRSIFLAPLTGAVFSVLLFVLFAGGVLKGTVFPDIYTPSGRFGSISQIRQTAPPDSSPSPSPSPAVKRTPAQLPDEPGAPTSSDATPATPSNSPKVKPSPESTKSPVATPTASVSPSPSPSPSPTSTATDNRNAIAFSDFIQQTGPTSGINYALLIIWSFLAGFLERLVPDALSKLVAKSDS